MGVLEDKLYFQDNPPFGEADVLGRKILRYGKFISRDVYKYNGTYYTVVCGRVVNREVASALERERNQEKRNQLKDHGSVKTR